jgi:hypothetical protein
MIQELENYASQDRNFIIKIFLILVILIFLNYIIKKIRKKRVLLIIAISCIKRHL